MKRRRLLGELSQASQHPFREDLSAPTRKSCYVTSTYPNRNRHASFGSRRKNCRLIARRRVRPRRRASRSMRNALKDLEYLPWYDQLHLARLREGLTQQQLAAYCGLGQKTIPAIERGKDVKMSTVTKVCQQLSHRVVIAFSDE